VTAPQTSPGRRAVPIELVGAGPGDPDLLTLRAEAALAAATVVVTDRAVAQLARSFAPDAIVTVTTAGGPDRGSIDRGATVDGDTVALVTGSARRGERVVRLYRGDPWLHPAFAVESAILAAAGLEVVTVPGLAVELAVLGVAGIASHHRPLAATVTIAPPAALPPARDPARTLVTATDDASWAVDHLARDGDAAMPVAVVATGRRWQPRVIRGTLGELSADGPLGAGVVVVGAVAGPPAATSAADGGSGGAGLAEDEGEVVGG
jgi:uroporphyrinogen III methyltransferase/synthase